MLFLAAFERTDLVRGPAISRNFCRCASGSLEDGFRDTVVGTILQDKYLHLGQSGVRFRSSRRSTSKSAMRRVGGSSNVPLGFFSLTENLIMIAMTIWIALPRV